MLGRLDKLNSSVITRADADVRRQRHLWQAHGTRVRIVRRARDLEGRNDGVAHVFRDLAESEVDVDQGGCVAREPARLEGDCTAADGPFGPVGRSGHTAAWEVR